MKKKNFTTDTLGFTLLVEVNVGDYPSLGEHLTYENEVGEVFPDAPHELNFQQGLDSIAIADIISHEVYHMFFSVRHLITAEEEQQAEVFGEIVGKIFELYFDDEHENPSVSV